MASFQEIQNDAQTIFQQTKIKIDSSTIEDRPKLLEVCQCYFTSAEGETWDSEKEQLLNRMEFTELKGLTLALARESFNRDLIKYVRDGARGGLSHQMLTQFN